MFPDLRLRRLRRHPRLRDLVRETSLQPHNFILPIFVRHGLRERTPIASMPGQFQLGLSHLADEVREIESLGISAVILFGIPRRRTPSVPTPAPIGIVQRAVRAIKAPALSLLVMTDVCFCEFTDHGHCGSSLDGT